MAREKVKGQRLDRVHCGLIFFATRLLWMYGITPVCVCV